eukprot:881607-Lingulodinium_polyedra.AAC.1
MEPQDYGVPLMDAHAFAVLVREDAGGQAAAERAAGLARALRGDHARSGVPSFLSAVLVRQKK